MPFYFHRLSSPSLFKGLRQPPAFPCRLQHSIIGRFSLNLRVRDGYGCFPEAHRHRNLRVTDRKCRKYFIRLWKARFPNALWDIFYKRRSRDRGTSFRGALTLNNSTVKHIFYFFFLRKEVIQPHLPIRLPCYDFTPVTCPAFGSSPLSVESLTSGVADSHGVTGGVYKTRERIHRDILIRDY